jgi:pre-rRNA-processing protein RIX1
MTHPYQTLVREITTPTLPTFVTYCLNLVSSKSSGKQLDVPSSLIEAVFCSFATLLPRHTTIFRTDGARIRSAIKPYLAPTSVESFVSSSLKDSARCLFVLLHLTVAKNAGGDDWGKAVRDLVKETHLTADQVFRAVIEDWESTVGYIGVAVDVNQELARASTTTVDLPHWSGIDAGIERLVGLLSMLSEYFKNETTSPVSIPLGSIVDMITRMLSIPIPSSSGSSGSGNARLHPAVDRDERDRLWSGMPQIYVAALKVIRALAELLQTNFVPFAQVVQDQLAWAFSSGSHDPAFRAQAYGLLLATLPLSSPDQSQITKLKEIIRSCCHDIVPVDGSINSGSASGDAPARLHAVNHNPDAMLHSKIPLSVDVGDENMEMHCNAKVLLPLFISHIPQQYLSISLRSLIDRTAILSHNKDAMLASILHPFPGKNCSSIASVTPYLIREFGHDAIIELLLRPRMPLVLAAGANHMSNHHTGDDFDDEDMDMHQEVAQPVTQDNAVFEENNTNGNELSKTAPARKEGFDNISGLGNEPPHWGTEPPSAFGAGLMPPPMSLSSHTMTLPQPIQKNVDVPMEEASGSDDESVHLNMELDTESSEEDS